MLVAALTLSAAACNRTPHDKLIDRAIVHLEAAEDMMAEAKGDPTALGLAVMHYRQDHRADLMSLRAEADAALRGASDAERKEMAQRSQLRTTAVMNRLLAATKRFPVPRRARRLIQPLILQTTPTAVAVPRKVKRPWMPPLPPLPGDKEGPEGAGDREGGAGDHDDHHGHAHAPGGATPTAAGY